MNFEFMSSLSIIRPFYSYCKDAEAYAYTKPDISGASALKAIEYIVRLMYTAAIQTEANQLSVYDMLCSPDFVIYLDDRVLLNAVHVIRRKGATAVQFGGLTQKDALEVLEQLHFVAGEVCIFLGLIDNYPVFDVESVPRLPAPNKADSTLFNQEEPTVEEAIIRQFADRLKNVDHYSQLRNQTNRFVNVHINTSKDKNTKKVNTSTNVRTSFGIITKWIKAACPDYMIEADTRIMVLTMRKENQLIRFSVRMGCTNLGTRDMEGEWKMLPGIDYVFYCFDIDPQQEPIEQFHVFSRDEFLQMWRDLDLIILKISTTQHQKLREIYGEDIPSTYTDPERTIFDGCDELETVIVYGGEKDNAVLERIKGYFEQDVRVIWEGDEQTGQKEEPVRRRSRRMKTAASVISGENLPLPYQTIIAFLNGDPPLTVSSVIIHGLVSAS